MGFCTIEDVRDLLQLAITDSDQIDAVNHAIDAATEAIKNYCHQTISLVEADALTVDIDGDYHTKIFLPELPVISVASVVEDGTTLTDTDDYKLGQHGILHRIDDYWEKGVQIVTITYTHGYSTIPDDIVDVCTRSASRIFQAGLRSASQNGITGVASMSLGDYSVSYGSEHGGGVGEGVMGVSAARALLMSEKDLLNRYRYIQQ